MNHRCVMCNTLYRPHQDAYGSRVIYDWICPQCGNMEISEMRRATLGLGMINEITRRNAIKEKLTNGIML